MSNYLTRNIPVVTGTAGADLAEGTVVTMASTGIVSALAASTGTALGVVADFQNAVDGITNSGSVINIITASPVFKVRCNGAVTKGAGLMATGSNGQFKAAGQKMAVSGSTGAGAPDEFWYQYNAIALAAGADNDIIPAVKPWF